MAHVFTKEDFIAALKKLPRWMVFTDTSPMAKRGPLVADRIKEHIHELTLAFQRPQVDVDTGDLYRALFDSSSEREILRAEIAIPKTAAGVDEFHSKLAILATYYALGQRLGAITIERDDTTEDVTYVGLSEEEVYAMYADNAELVYIMAQRLARCNQDGIPVPGKTRFEGACLSKAPIRRWGFCNHYEYMLPNLWLLLDKAERSDYDRELAAAVTSETTRVAALIKMREIHTQFLKNYLVRLGQAKEINLPRGLAMSMAMADVFAELTVLRGQAGDYWPALVHAIIDLVERRLSTWDMN